MKTPMNPNLALASASRSHRLWLWAGVSLLLVSLGAWLLWPSYEPAASVIPPLRVSTVTAGPAMLDSSLLLNGTLAAREEIAISSSLPEQRVAEVKVEEGDSVQAGQLLARLETQSLDAQVRQAKAVWARACAIVAQQEAVKAESEASFKRIELLSGSGAVSEQQVDQSRAQAVTAAASLRAARAEVEQAFAQLVDARHQRSKADIQAPFAGVIAERTARSGSLSGGDPLFRQALGQQTIGRGRDPQRAVAIPIRRAGAGQDDGDGRGGVGRQQGSVQGCGLGMQGDLGRDRAGEQAGNEKHGGQHRHGGLLGGEIRRVGGRDRRATRASFRRSKDLRRR